jgi:hypothetical protein
VACSKLGGKYEKLTVYFIEQDQSSATNMQSITMKGVYGIGKRFMKTYLVFYGTGPMQCVKHATHHDESF